MRHAHHVLGSILALASFAGAQEDPKVRFLKAVTDKHAAAAVKKLHIERIPAKELVAVFPDNSTLLRDFAWHWLRHHVRARRLDLMRLWHKDPEVRKNYPQLYAKLPVNWMEQHATVGKAKRADIESVAAEMGYDPQRLELMHSEDKTLAASATVFQRRAARASIDRETKLIAAIREARPGAIASGSPRDPFRLGARMVDAIPIGRADAAMKLRRLLNLPVPNWVATRLSTHSFATLSDREPIGKATMQDLDEYLDCAERGHPNPLVQSADLSGLPQAARQVAARRLIAIGITKQVRTVGWAQPEPDGAFADAIRLDKNAFAELVRMANASTDAVVQQRILHGLRQINRAATRYPKGIEAELLPLLDRAPAIATAAAWLLACVIKDQCDPAVRRSLGQRATKILTEQPESMKMRVPDVWNCTSDLPLPDPTNAQPQIVLLAARLGHPDLLQPLVDLATKANLVDRGGHGQSLWRALTELAPHITPQQATRLIALTENATAESAHARQALSAAAHGVLFALYGVASAEQLDHIEEVLGRELSGRVHYASSASLAATVPSSRIRRLLKKCGMAQPDPSPSATMSELYAHCPELLLEAWQSKEPVQQDAAARHLSILITQNGQQTQPLLMQWPVPFVARALALASPAMQDDGQTVSLELIQRVQSEDARKDGAWRHLLPIWNLSAANVEAFSQLAQTLRPEHAMAAARRLHETSKAGREAAVALVNTHLASKDVPTCVAALTTALSLNLSNSEWQPAAERIRDLHKNTADAARVKFGDVKLLDCDEPTELILSHKMVVDAETLQNDKVDLHHLLWAHAHLAEATAAEVLTLFAKQPQWSKKQTRSVLDATLNKFAGVRRAAYAALATRDRELCPAAWLAYEAALDHDRSVHSASPDAKPEQKNR